MKEPTTENKIILVVRRTRLDELIERFNTLEQARFYVEHLGSDFLDYQSEDTTYKKSLLTIQKVLSRHARVQVIDRSFLTNFIFGPNDLVMAVGQDGLVANVLKYLNGQKLVGINPDPARWEGVLLPFQVTDLNQIVPELLADKRPIREVTMAEARLNTGETICGVNDLFIGPRSHTSARYSINFADRNENHSSSGIIVSTGLGSTGWLRSILAGATGITSLATGQPPPIPTERSFDWSSPELVFSVREPWPSKNSDTSIVFGRITKNQPLKLVSQMPGNGIIFSDGIESDFVLFNSGTEAVITLAKRRGLLVS